MKILVINGPNINMLGIREPQIYGDRTFEDLTAYIEEVSARLGVEVEQFQSNHEGELIDRIHEAYRSVDGIVINPGAYGHTSIAILDAIKAVGIPTVEVHITDTDGREPFRETSFISLVAEKIIKGKGFSGYEEAMTYLADRFSDSH